MLPATFAQANVLSEPLMQSDVVPATLVESTVLQLLGGRGLGRDLAVARTACPRGGESRGRRPRRRVNDDRDEGVVDVRESGVAVLLQTNVLHAPWG